MEQEPNNDPSTAQSGLSKFKFGHCASINGSADWRNDEFDSYLMTLRGFQRIAISIEDRTGDPTNRRDFDLWVFEAGPGATFTDTLAVCEALPPPPDVPGASTFGEPFCEMTIGDPAGGLRQFHFVVVAVDGTTRPYDLRIVSRP